MKLMIDVATLIDALGALQHVVTRRSPIPHLSCVKITALDDVMVEFAATDMEVAISLLVPAKATGDPVLIPGAKLFEMAKAMSGGTVTIKEEKGRVAVKNAGFTSKLNTHPLENYPELPKKPEKSGVVIPGEALRQLISLTKFSAGGSDNRYFLAGVAFEVAEGFALMVGASNTQMGVATVKIAEGHEPQVLIPIGALSDIVALVDDGGTEEKNDIVYTPTSSHLFFESIRRSVVTRVIDGKFPKYQSFIPTDHDKEATIERGPFSEVLRRVALVTTLGKSAVRMVFAGGSLTVDVATSDIGEAAETIPTLEYKGDDITLAVNATFVRQFMTAVKTPTVLLSMKDKDGSIMLRPVGEDAPDYRYVCMTTRLEVLGQ